MRSFRNSPTHIFKTLSQREREKYTWKDTLYNCKFKKKVTTMAKLKLFTLADILLHVAFVRRIHGGNSRSSASVVSSSSRLWSSPSPLRNLTLILLGERFFVNLTELKRNKMDNSLTNSRARPASNIASLDQYSTLIPGELLDDLVLNQTRHYVAVWELNWKHFSPISLIAFHMIVVRSRNARLRNTFPNWMMT